MGLVNDVFSEGLVFVPAVEGEDVEGLTVGALVDLEPFAGGVEVAGLDLFDVFEVVQLVGVFVVDVDNDREG